MENSLQKELHIKVNTPDHISLERVMNEFSEQFKSLQVFNNSELIYPMGLEISEEVNRKIITGILDALRYQGIQYTNLWYEETVA